MFTSGIYYTVVMMLSALSIMASVVVLYVHYIDSDIYEMPQAVGL